jgi:hypothetical protein
MSFQTVSTIVSFGVVLAALCWLVQQLFINRIASTNQARAIKVVEESIALNREILESNRDLITAIRESTAAQRQRRPDSSPPPPISN